MYAEGKERLALKLISMVPGLPRTTECNNCGEESCLTGQPVLHEKMRKGLEVKFNRSAGHWEKSWNAPNFTVMDVLAPDNVKLRFKDRSGTGTWYKSVYGQHQFLCYDC